MTCPPREMSRSLQRRQGLPEGTHANQCPQYEHNSDHVDGLARGYGKETPVEGEERELDQDHAGDVYELQDEEAFEEGRERVQSGGQDVYVMPDDVAQNLSGTSAKGPLWLDDPR